MNSIFGKTIFSIIVVFLFAAAPLMSYSQTPKPEPRQPPVTAPLPVASPRPTAPPAWNGRDTYERSIAVDKNVAIKLCVTQGTLKINGWNRNEVRVFVKDGSNFAFQIVERGRQDSPPTWISLTGFVSGKNKIPAPNGCIWGEDIEIDAPVNSAVTMTGGDTTTTVDSIRKIDVRTIGGDISVRNITERTRAVSGQGSITVDESQGTINLDSTTGNIVVFEARPGEPGDTFRARTNSGNVLLERIDHRQMDVGSVSGSVVYTGDILNSGAYSFNTTNGSLKLTLPQKTSCQVVASYGFGNFTSEIPIKLETENITPGPIKRQVGTMGTGGATLKLTTNSGSIVIKKQ